MPEENFWGEEEEGKEHTEPEDTSDNEDAEEESGAQVTMQHVGGKQLRQMLTTEDNDTQEEIEANLRILLKYLIDEHVSKIIPALNTQLQDAVFEYLLLNHGKRLDDLTEEEKRTSLVIMLPLSPRGDKERGSVPDPSDPGTLSLIVPVALLKGW